MEGLKVVDLTAPSLLRAETDSSSLASSHPSTTAPRPVGLMTFATRKGAGRASSSSSISSLSAGTDSPATDSAAEEEEPAKLEPELGRGKRLIKPTVVWIDGHPVKVDNTYQVRGERYVYTSFKAPAPSRPAARPAPAKLPSKPSRAPRESDKMRMVRERNDKIRAGRDSAETKRTKFLRRHFDVLEPFLPDDVAVRLRKLPMPKPETPSVLGLQPECVKGGEMRDYQLLGLQWLISRYDNGISCILGDEMGLGKTLQTIAYLGYLKFERKLDTPSLVVCPLSVLSSWMNECARWCPDLKVLQLHTSDIKERKRVCREVLPRGDYDVVVTTYEMVKNPVCRHMLVQNMYWRCLVLDEGHIIRNEATDVAQAVRRMHTEQIVLLTGTPLQNNLHELWGLLNVMMPTTFSTSDKFDGCFDLRNHVVDKSLLERAHHLLKPFMLRRLKVEVEKGLPPRHEYKLYCPLSEQQVFWYKRLLLKDAEVVDRWQNKGDNKAAATDWQRLQALFVQLRKCCNHPYLFNGAEAEDSTDQDLIQASGKLEMLSRLLPKLKAKGHRVVLFSQWTGTLDIIDDYLRTSGYKYLRLDGSTNRIQRLINIESFNAPQSPYFAFIMTTRAGGLGVNLQTADTCILFDSDFNPQPDLQAMARVHRIGQTKVVHVYRLVSTGTIEERVVEHAEKKLYLDQMVNRDSLVDADSGARREDELNQTELMETLKFGADSTVRLGEGRTFTDVDLDRIIDRTNRPQADSEDTLFKTDKKECMTFDASKQLQSTRMLQGQIYTKMPAKVDSLGDICAQWAEETAKRKRQSRIQMLDGLGSGYGAPIPVLMDNMYDLCGGESSVFARELKGRGTADSFRDVKRKVQRPGVDYEQDEYCIQCWDGGSMLCCDQCPAVIHLKCLGLRKQDILPKFLCPHHACHNCNRKPAAAGGMLFRCVCCPIATCYDCRNPDWQVVGENERFATMGYDMPTTACYIYCSADCKEWAEKNVRGLPALPPPYLQPAKKVKHE